MSHDMKTLGLCFLILILENVFFWQFMDFIGFDPGLFLSIVSGVIMGIVAWHAADYLMQRKE